MKNLFRLLLLVTALLAFTPTADAQNDKGSQRRVRREQLAEKQAKHIAEKLSLSPELSEKFVTTYMACQKETWSTKRPDNFRRKGRLTEEQTDSLLQARFDHSQKLLDIRKKYYAEYRTFLTPKQIERVYRIERRMMNRLFQHAGKKDKK